MRFEDNGSKSIEFMVHLKVKNLSKEEEKKFFSVPVYVTLNDNEVEFYPPVLDFGILYSNSGIFHKLQLKTRGNGRDSTHVGYPYVPINTYFQFDFAKLVSNYGYVPPNNSYLIGQIILNTQGLNDGNYTGHILFWRDKHCSQLGGSSRIVFRFIVAKDPLNAKTKMHSFEINQKYSDAKKRAPQNQILWLKNTFPISTPLRIDDITWDDKELSLIYLVKKKLEELHEDDQYSCFSADNTLYASWESR